VPKNGKHPGCLPFFTSSLFTLHKIVPAAYAARVDQEIDPYKVQTKFPPRPVGAAISRPPTCPDAQCAPLRRAPQIPTAPGGLCPLLFCPCFERMFVI